MIPKNIIVVGQGIAASALVWHAKQQHLDIIVIDQPKNNISSSIAAGLYNPITGRTFQKTWLADKIFPYMEKFYREIERETNSKILYPKNIIKPFWNKKEFNFWNSCNNLNKNYIQIIENHNNINIKPKFGAAKITNSGHVDIKVFLEETKKYLIKNQSYIEDKFEHELLKIDENKIRYKNIIADKIIFCEGIYGCFNPFFKHLPFRPVTGEVIEGKISQKLPNMYNREIFILPKENNKIVIGATFKRIEEKINVCFKQDNLRFNNELSTSLISEIRNLSPTSQAYEYLIQKANKIIDLKLELINQKIGIRPCTLDRRPFVGFHPKYRNVGILNGLGTKGVSLAPYMANHLINITNNTECIQEDVFVGRKNYINGSIRAS